jgi:hypothetical protein
VKESKNALGPKHARQLLGHRALVGDADRNGLHPRNIHRCIGHWTSITSAPGAMSASSARAIVAGRPASLRARSSSRRALRLVWS